MLAAAVADAGVVTASGAAKSVVGVVAFVGVVVSVFVDCCCC